MARRRRLTVRTATGHSSELAVPGGQSGLLAAPLLPAWPSSGPSLTQGLAGLDSGDRQDAGHRF